MQTNFPEYLKECVELLGGKDKVTHCWRYETGEFIGFFLCDKSNKPYLPADKTRRAILQVLNNYIITVELLGISYEQDALFYKGDYANKTR